MSPAARRAGVVGWPVAHSLSPLLHGAWIAAAGLDASYEAIPVEPDGAADALRALGEAGYAGVNVTVPHKTTALAVADEASRAAEAIGAANLLVFENGRIRADNTDAAGFHLGLKEAGRAAWTFDLALVLGAGGAARAAAYALKDGGCGQVVIANRSADKARALGAALGGNTVPVPWEQRGMVAGDAGLIVNATSLGMAGSAPLELDLAGARADAVVYDLVYAPLETPLLAAARARGLKTVDGLGMLIGQARPSFEAFFGVPAPVEVDARALLVAALEERR